MERERRTRQSNREYRERIQREISQNHPKDEYERIRVVPRSDERLRSDRQKTYTMETGGTSVNMYGAGEQVRSTAKKRPAQTKHKKKKPAASKRTGTPAKKSRREEPKRQVARRPADRSAARTGQEQRAGRAQEAQSGSYFDYTLVFIVLFLIMFGLLMLYTASIYTDKYFVKQFKMSLGGLVAMIVFSQIDYHLYAKKQMLLLIALGSVGAVLLVLTPLGVNINGATRWIGFKGFTIQPAEIFKIAVILVNAALLVKFNRIITTKRVLVVFALLAVFDVGLIFLVTENLSSALIVGMITVLMVFVAHPGYKMFFGAAAALGVIAAGFIYYVLHSGVNGKFRFGRIIAWLTPEKLADQSKVHQTNQALYAIGSGGLWGKGLGSGIQKMILPEAVNDMIFAIICEELGMVGAFLVMVMFAILLYRLMFIAKNAKDLLGGMIVSGIFAHLMLQVVLNLGVVTNLLPSTGVTLPFISYGGTATVLLMSEIGIALNVSKQIDFQQPKLLRRKKQSSQARANAARR